MYQVCNSCLDFQAACGHAIVNRRCPRTALALVYLLVLWRPLFLHLFLNLYVLIIVVATRIYQVSRCLLINQVAARI